MKEYQYTCGITGEKYESYDLASLIMYAYHNDSTITIINKDGDDEIIDKKFIEFSHPTLVTYYKFLADYDDEFKKIQKELNWPYRKYHIPVYDINLSFIQEYSDIILIFAEKSTKSFEADYYVQNLCKEMDLTMSSDIFSNPDLFIINHVFDNKNYSDVRYGNVYMVACKDPEFMINLKLSSVVGIDFKKIIEFPDIDRTTLNKIINDNLNGDANGCIV